jgi:hypothetical protein
MNSSILKKQQVTMMVDGGDIITVFPTDGGIATLDQLI